MSASKSYCIRKFDDRLIIPLIRLLWNRLSIWRRNFSYIFIVKNLKQSTNVHKSCDNGVDMNEKKEIKKKQKIQNAIPPCINQSDQRVTNKNEQNSFKRTSLSRSGHLSHKIYMNMNTFCVYICICYDLNGVRLINIRKFTTRTHTFTDAICIWIILYVILYCA